jgi:hypothetical protein
MDNMSNWSDEDYTPVKHAFRQRRRNDKAYDEDDEYTQRLPSQQLDNSDKEDSDLDELDPTITPAPPYSHFNSAARRNRRRKATYKVGRVKWSEKQTNTLIALMQQWPHDFQRILSYDQSTVGSRHLVGLTPAQLKDKVRNIAKIMIQYVSRTLPFI